MTVRISQPPIPFKLVSDANDGALEMPADPGISDKDATGGPFAAEFNDASLCLAPLHRGQKALLSEISDPHWLQCFIIGFAELSLHR